MDRIDLGRKGEEEAVRHLKARGWRIIDQNVRVGRREIDLIAYRGGILAFVEVKARSGTGWGEPAEAITRSKQRDVAAAARGWLKGRAIPPGTTLRFDAVAVLCPRNGPAEIHHIPDAWRLD